MDQKTKNKLKMYQAVQMICLQHEADWSSLPAFNAVFALFTAKLNELKQSGYRQGTATLGVRAGKDQLLQTTVGLAETIANGLRAYAAGLNDATLREQLHFSKWDFKRYGTQATLYLIDRILEIAHPLAALTGDYGISQLQLTDLQHLRQQLGDAVGMPRAAIIDRKQQTAAIADLQHELDRLLKTQLDPLARVLRTGQPGFYTNYRNARIIVDYKGKTNGHGEVVEPPHGPAFPDE